MKTKFNLRALLIFNFLLPVLLLLVIQEVACKTTPTSPDSFYRAVVTCTSANTANPQAEQAVYQCLTDIVDGAYAGCLSGLVASALVDVRVFLSVEMILFNLSAVIADGKGIRS